MRGDLMYIMIVKIIFIIIKLKNNNVNLRQRGAGGPGSVHDITLRDNKNLVLLFFMTTNKNNKIFGNK